uniref:Uncharacterized protein n=1 Tax=Arundo donax TaxID=35708 RepID=A0A0A9CVQ7_ARUDO
MLRFSSHFAATNLLLARSRSSAPPRAWSRASRPLHPVPLSSPLLQLQAACVSCCCFLGKEFLSTVSG